VDRGEDLHHVRVELPGGPGQDLERLLRRLAPGGRETMRVRLFSDRRDLFTAEGLAA
jgi:hypothetical protein